MTPDLTVLIPSDSGREFFGPLPDHVRLDVWNGTGDPPPSAPSCRFWVPPFLPHDGLVEAFAAMPALEVVQLLTAGAERFIEVKPEGVTVCNARGAHTGPTAEWVLAAILASYRMFPRFLAAQREGRWDYAVNEELAGRRVLIVGAGDIAERVKRMLAGFDVAVELVGRTARAGRHGVDELPGLLAGFDVVVLLIPLTEATHGLVDATFLAGMDDGAMLVNAARGPVVDTDALLAELTSTRLRAALDVTEPEPLPEGHPLWSAPNLLLTPHVAGSVPGATPRAYAIAGDQLRRFAAGMELQNVVGEY
ncbi:MAG: 2-hydroxyacid dehydrogenase [Geodermatophilaceae bacterium]|nr:2-hydroxyacid dehydrogenase [Geodermatophilaceae bacterium]